LALSFMRNLPVIFFLAFLASCCFAADTVEKGTLTVHLLLHAVGTETYDVHRVDPGGRLQMDATLEYSDRGTKRTQTASLRMRRDYTPESLDVKGRTASAFKLENATTASVREGDADRKFPLPRQFFAAFGNTPFSTQMMLMRYWMGHGRPARLTIPRAGAAAEDSKIELVGDDAISIAGKNVALKRYTITNLAFGKEVLWLNDQAQLAAVMTFAGGLPFEAVRTEYEPALQQLFRSGVSEEMRILSAFDQQVPAENSGAFAIAGATLVDAVTGHSPIPDSVVIVQGARITAMGRRDQVAIPSGMPVVDGAGRTLLPGLWEMHTHFSGVEFGPALLAAGVTTARDCGGEFDFLVAARDAIEKQHGLGPRLLLAGLVDGGGADAFGAVTADSADEARLVVAYYHGAGFQQIKLYTLLKPDVVAALAAEAHQFRMTVTGHVPSRMDTFQAVEAGMDQINHLNFVSRTLRAADSHDPIDFKSGLAVKAIQFFQERQTVVDPTVSWGEMAGHTKDMAVSSFEPGIGKAPYSLASKFMSLGAPVTGSEAFQARMAENLAVIGALHKARVPIVAGSDTGLIGFGLHREIELYVKAGMTPLEAIQSATIVSARAMNMDREAGTIEVGKRADLILVDGNPLQNISDIRKVSSVIANGRRYDCKKLRAAAGFLP
jgi:imidazolonepropionase-like amidohydrolase